MIEVSSEYNGDLHQCDESVPWKQKVCQMEICVQEAYCGNAFKNNTCEGEKAVE